MMVNRYHITILAIAIVVLSLSYYASIRFIDSILLDYDAISLTSDISSNPDGLKDRISILRNELDRKTKLIETLRERKPFYPNLFRDIGVNSGCDLTNLEKTELPKNQKTQFRVVYTGGIKHLLNLLNSLESNYYLNVLKAGLQPESDDGKLLRLIIILQVSTNE